MSNEAMRAALELAIRQNEHDMLMTGDELRKCKDALSQQPAQPTVKESLTVHAQPTEHVMGLLGAACYVINKYEPESNLLQKIRDVTFGRNPAQPSYEPVNLSLPHDFITHKDAWRNALVLCVKNARAPTVDSGEPAYWMHEVKAFDRAYAAIKPEQPSCEPVQVSQDACPDCGRNKAHSADDCMTGLCPKWWAMRDLGAKEDCKLFKESQPVAFSNSCEALRAENERLKESAKRIDDLFGSVIAERNSAEQSMCEFRLENEVLKARNDELESAFAKASKACSSALLALAHTSLDNPLYSDAYEEVNAMMPIFMEMRKS